MFQDYRARLANVKEVRKELDDVLQVNTQEKSWMIFLKGGIVVLYL